MAFFPYINRQPQQTISNSATSVTKSKPQHRLTVVKILQGVNVTQYSPLKRDVFTNKYKYTDINTFQIPTHTMPK